MKNFKMNSLVVLCSMMAFAASASASGTLLKPSSIENRSCLSIASAKMQDEGSTTNLTVVNQGPDTDVAFIALTIVASDAPRYAANEILIDAGESGKCLVYDNPVSEEYFFNKDTDYIFATVGKFVVSGSADMTSTIISYEGSGLSCGPSDYRNRTVKSQLELRGRDLYRNSMQVIGRNPCPLK